MQSKLIWVNASAGTGKTRLLTDRALSLMLAGTNPKNILCLTFTKAAAMEMQTRIRDRISSWARMPSGALTQDLSDLTASLNIPGILDTSENIIKIARGLLSTILQQTPHITTIHEFCLELIAHFPIESQIKPNFSVIDEAESEILMQNAITALLCDAEIEDQDIAILAANLPDFRGTISKLAYQIRELEFENSREAILSLYERLDAKENTPEPHPADEIISLLKAQQQRKILDRSGQISFAQYKSLFLTKEQKIRKYPKLPEIPQHLIQQEQHRLVELINKKETAEIAKQTTSLIKVLYKVRQIYIKLKRRKSYLDFDDIIDESCKLLTKSEHKDWVLNQLNYRIDHILLDEAQDTSHKQWQIIQALCAEFFAGQGARQTERSLFVVGDIKQSIYSFQDADPAVFLSMHQYWVKQTQTMQEIRLERNFRSTKPILAIVDAVFNQKELLNAITLEEKPIKHLSERMQDAGRVELWPLAEKRQEQEDDIWNLNQECTPEEKPMKLLAEAIANTISDWLKKQRMLPAKNRPVEAGDILILVAHRNKFVQYLAKALKQAQIENTGSNRIKITDSIAVMDLIKLTEFVLNPQDDLSLAIALKSPLFELEEEELFLLAHGRAEKTLWERIEERAKSNEKLNRFNAIYQALQDLIAKSATTTPVEFYTDIIIHNRKKILSRLGKESSDYLDGLIEAAWQFEEKNIPCLELFLQWLKSSNYTIKCDPSQNRHQVRIMTVHSAKGLQAPIVFLADTTDIPKNKNNIIFDRDNLPIWTEKYQSKYCNALKQSNRQAQFSEYLRLLYVALTRAEDELFITGWQGRTSKNCWYRILENTIKETFACEERILMPMSGQPAKIYYSASPQLRQPEPQPSIARTSKQEALPESFKLPINFSMEAEKILRPSQQEQDTEIDHGAVLLGKAAHKLLEYLPQQNKLPSINAIHEYLKNYFPDLDKKLYGILTKSVIGAIKNPQISKFLSAKSITELPVKGYIDGKKISGKIDRICLLPKEILIMDYKFAAHNMQNEQKARTQLSCYKKLIAHRFVNYKINCAIVWLLPAEIQIMENL
ncbi:double-strand break repair helicase AddA [Rickettsiales bacterium]|nr:double-strand break repair helicase AddA [Rickettsiales bacterium]